MSSTTINKRNKLINDIHMDHFGSSTDWLGTTGISPCVGFIILLNNNEHIFIEHRSDIYFPSELNLDNVRLCFKNIAKHVSRILPESNITTVLILGGIDDKSRFDSLQMLINEMLQIQIGVDDDKNESSYYKQLLKNIICNDVCFNMTSVFPQITGECSLDLIVDRYPEDDLAIIGVQHVKKFATSDIIVGVLIIQIKSNNRWFMVDASQIKNDQNKVKEELDYLVTVTNHFRSHAECLGAIEVGGDEALRLLIDAKTMLEHTTVDLKRQIRLKNSDRQMNKDLGSSNNKTTTDDYNEDDDEDQDSSDDDDTIDFNNFKTTTT